MLTEDIAQLILAVIRRQNPKLIAIDGRCAAGKTTLAEMLAGQLECNIVHMDHFFLRPGQRTAERLQQAGGNVDYERVLEEVLIPLCEGQMVSYCPFNCHTQAMEEPVFLKPGRLTIVEGSYSCHPALRSYYDMTVFLQIDAEEQMRRIRLRNGAEDALIFENRWIPMEEYYFRTFLVQEKCDLCFRGGENQ